MPDFSQNCCHIAAMEAVGLAARLERKLPGLERHEAAAGACLGGSVEACARRQFDPLEGETGKSGRGELDHPGLAVALFTERFRQVQGDRRLHPTNQLLDAGSKSFGDPHQHAERRISLPGLQMSKGRPWHARALGELLLRQFPAFTQAPQVGGKHG